MKARITWVDHPEPWLLDPQLINSLSLPLNLDQNSPHPFHGKLSALRLAARTRPRRDRRRHRHQHKPKW